MSPKQIIHVPLRFQRLRIVQPHGPTHSAGPLCHPRLNNELSSKGRVGGVVQYNSECRTDQETLDTIRRYENAQRTVHSEPQKHLLHVSKTEN